MNTKGIKFLAVLAVMVMAFAAIVVLAPADKDTDAVIVYGEKSEVIVDPTVIDDTITKNKFYISDDATVKIKDLSGITGNVEFYVQNGVELELDFKQAAATTSHTPAVDKTIVIYTVTGDQQRVTTSTVDGADKTVSNGKIIINSSKFQFTGADKQNVVYTALMPLTVETTTTSGPIYTTEVSTYGSYGNYALISVSNALTGDIVVGKYVAVASGQSIESEKAIDGLNYGIAYFDKKNDDNKEMYTYYAAGINAGTIAIEADDTVTIVNGSVIVNNNTASVKASSAKGTNLVLAYAENEIDISGKLTSGTMTVSGKVKFAAGFENKATITLNASADVVSDSEMTVTGTLVLKNEAKKVKELTVSGAGFIVAENEKLWTYRTVGGVQEAYLEFANTTDGETEDFTGQYDVTAINKNADVYDAFATAKIERNQTFRMIGDTVVAGSLTIAGTLIIEPGVTMTISQLNEKGASAIVTGQYSQIINNGTIIIKTNTPLTAETQIGLYVDGGTVMNNGTINASSLKGAAENDTLVVDYDDTTPRGYGFVNNGTISIGKYDTANFDEKFTNNSDGSVTVSGTLKADALVNKGMFTVNNATITSETTDFKVTMSKGAEFKIVSANVAAGTTMIIQNALSDDVPANFVSIATEAASGTAAATAEPVRISGLTVTDSTLLSKKLDVSGTIATNGTATLATKGNIDVTGSFTVSKGYKLDFTEKTNLNVYGTANIAADVVLADGTDANGYELHMIVDGLVTDVDGILSKVETFKYVAASYTLSNGTTTIYTNLADAIDSAVEAEVTQINVGNDDSDAKNPLFITVIEDLTIPEGITVDGKYLEVDDKATIYVNSGARFSFDEIVIQDGMIAADDVNSIDYDQILADVKEQDEESTAAVCMSLEVALAIATPGTVIELANPFYAADADLVIPAGVTVNATVNEGTDFVLVNSNLVVEGTLAVDHFAFIATTDDTIGITVSGYIYDKDTGACFKGWWYTPFGVSYYETDDDDHTWYVITTIENIQPAIDVADNAEVTVEGDAVLDELNVQGRDDMPGTVNFNGNVDIDNIVIDEVTLNFTKGKEVNTTVRNAVGSITITGAYADDNLSIFDMAIYSTEEVGVYMEGVVTDGAYATYGILFEGITGMDSTDVRTDIKWTSTEESPAIVFDGVTTVIGKKAYIQYDAETGTPAVGMVTISGTLTAYNNSKLTINSDVQIVGALVAAERTEDANPGAIETAGNIFVGMLVSDIYYMDAYPPVPTTATGDVAILSGKVALAAGKNIYVAPAAIIDPEIVDDLDTMGIYIDDELWFTLYGYENDKFTLNGLMVPMLNAEIYSILDENLDDVAYWAGNIIILSESKTLSGFGNVYITLDYNIFEVKIKTDGSVKAVYIDGILMETGESKNIFIMKNVAAGTHKVTVEAATGYDASKCVLYTEMGTILPNMGFTFTQFDCTETDIDPVTEDEIPVVVYNIKGTEIQPEPVPPTPEEESQWTVTTILLVILVVLIAIMAVIVALRLNRS